MTLTEKKKFFAVSIFLNKSKYIERGEKNYTSKTFMWALHRGGGGGEWVAYLDFAPCELNK